jgi:hypothetical protein
MIGLALEELPVVHAVEDVVGVEFQARLKESLDLVLGLASLDEVLLEVLQIR